MSTPQALSDPELLQKIHTLLLKMLKDFDRVCRELGIEYTVYGGTCIGAVRHQGFIPWDDDVDVLMTRKEYERFLKEAPAILPSEYRLDNTQTTPNYPFMFTKLGLKGTLLVPEFAKNSSYRMPVSLDILPLDKIPFDEKQFRAMSRQTWIWGRLLYVQGTPTPYLIDTFGLKRIAIYTATTIVHWTMRLLGINSRYLQKKWDRAARRYEDSDSRRYADFSMRDPWNWAVDHEELFPALEVPFENITVKIQREYDAVLKRSYGEYMELPPEEKRRNHRPCEIDFGPYLTDPS
ncbi:LicD family protein [Schaalia suimastitidis]|uniref:LicD family protein n=1 Tax=Schaalia suimastitidis TaxID=121163 RepID=UPI000429D0DF|nr:LicD family protein [Schaalia suimastitidis]